MARLRKSLDVLLDGLGNSENSNVGLLSFYGCWGKEDGPTHWLRLSAERLRNIFSVPSDEQAEIQIVSLECERGIVSENNRDLATFHGAQVRLSVIYTIPSGNSSHDWQIRVYQQKQLLVRTSLSAFPSDQIVLSIDTFEIVRYKNRINLRVALYRDEAEEISLTIHLHLCGELRPVFALVHPIFRVLDPQKADTDDQPRLNLEIDNPVHVYFFGTSGAPQVVDSNQVNVPTFEYRKELWRTATQLDPTSDADGQIVLEWNVGEKAGEISLEALDVERGEFTLEDELRVQLSLGKEKRLEELVTRFSGTCKDPYARLGELNDSSRHRSLIARQVTASAGYKPILTDLLGSPELSTAREINEHVTCLGSIDAGLLSNIRLPNDVLTILRNYIETRNRLIEDVRKTLDNNSSTEHPLYASHPIYCESIAEETSKLLCDYLRIYLALLEYLREQRELDWGQMFVLSHLDCVVHWPGVLRACVYLVGPWHPMVISKRFMVQWALYRRATRRLKDEGGKEFKQLSALLAGVHGFRWLPSLSAEERALELAYVSSTSDPGWHIALNRAISFHCGQSQWHDLAGVLTRISENFGLQTSVSNGYTEDLSAAALRSYLRAYPSRRSVAFQVPEDFTTANTVEVLDRFLHEEEGPSMDGREIPGGINLFLTTEVTRMDVMHWFDPPLRVYRYEDEEDLYRDHKPYVRLLPPAKDLVFSNGREELALPRGHDLASVFSSALTWVTEGARMTPIGALYEFDREAPKGDSIGDTFVKAAVAIGKLVDGTRYVVRSVHLPEKLKSNWAIVPGTEIDPAILVKYVHDGVRKEIEERALWDYRVDLAGEGSSFFILSTVPKGFVVAVNGFFGREDVAKSFLLELGQIGIAIGGEALKSGRHALGVLGLTGAVRLFWGLGNQLLKPLKQNPKLGVLGFLLPVDSFVEFFGQPTSSVSNGGGSKRTDLLAVQLMLSDTPSEKLRVSACGVESKFVSSTFGRQYASDALQQAHTTASTFRKLVEAGLGPDAMPERLGLLALLRFGLPSNPAFQLPGSPELPLFVCINFVTTPVPPSGSESQDIWSNNAYGKCDGA